MKRHGVAAARSVGTRYLYGLGSLLQCRPCRDTYKNRVRFKMIALSCLMDSHVASRGQTPACLVALHDIAPSQHTLASIATHGKLCM